MGKALHYFTYKDVNRIIRQVEPYWPPGRDMEGELAAVVNALMNVELDLIAAVGGTLERIVESIGPLLDLAVIRTASFLLQLMSKASQVAVNEALKILAGFTELVAAELTLEKKEEEEETNGEGIE